MAEHTGPRAGGSLGSKHCYCYFHFWSVTVHFWSLFGNCPWLPGRAVLLASTTEGLTDVCNQQSKFYTFRWLGQGLGFSFGLIPTQDLLALKTTLIFNYILFLGSGLGIVHPTIPAEVMLSLAFIAFMKGPTLLLTSPQAKQGYICILPILPRSQGGLRRLPLLPTRGLWYIWYRPIQHGSLLLRLCEKTTFVQFHLGPFNDILEGGECISEWNGCASIQTDCLFLIYFLILTPSLPHSGTEYNENTIWYNKI